MTNRPARRSTSQVLPAFIHGRRSIRLTFLAVIISTMTFAASCATQTDSLKGSYVFTPEMMRQQGDSLSLIVGVDANAEFWTPTSGDVARAIDATRNYLLEHTHDLGYKKPKNYDRTYTHQVFGVTNAGTKSIVVLGACRGAAREQATRMAQELLLVIDGANCFFQSVVSSDELNVLDFSFNAIGG